MVKLENICKTYHHHQIIKNFSADFYDNTITGIMGVSGVGKTTLLHIVMGIVKPDSGTISGVNPGKLAAVFQEDRLCEMLNAVENIKLVCDKKTTEEQVKQELLEIGLTDLVNKPVGSFSGGMKRRVAIVRALITKAEIIIMDEPFKGLDKALKYEMAAYIKKKANNKIVIFVTHDLEEIRMLEATKIIM